MTRRSQIVPFKGGVADGKEEPAAPDLKCESTRMITVNGVVKRCVCGL